MSTHIIDRRLNPQDKTIRNRKKYIDLQKEQLRKQVKEILDNGKIDITGSQKRVRVNPIKQPTFQRDRQTGDKDFVLPGNKDHIVGDIISKPQQGGGGKGSSGSNDPATGQVDFEFILTEEEFRELVFEEMELPDFVKKSLKSVMQFDTVRSGFKSDGSPSQLDKMRTMRNSIGRRIGLKRPKSEEMLKIEKVLASDVPTPAFRKQLEEELAEMERRRKAIPWIDPFDVRYRDTRKVFRPHTQAVMFCLMDVSWSMQEEDQEVAKRFFMLLNMFLHTKYKNVDVVFIKHHTEATECNEEEFFRGQETGGTIVSTALEKTEEIIKERYKPDDWNIYIAQASDGDNFGDDAQNVIDSATRLLNTVQYFAYIEILNASKQQYQDFNYATDLWNTYKKLLSFKNLAMQEGATLSTVWKVFSNLFHRTKKDDKHIHGVKEHA